jgi:signal transduction histidine kinase
MINSPSSSSTKAPMKILVVDDTEATRYAVARTLKAAGFEMYEAGTGKEGLRIAGEILPSLIILDIHLPDIMGFEVCRILKAQPATCEIPVLQISASFVTSKDRINGLEGGADSYLTHPVEPGVLIATVNALLRLRKALEQARSANEAKSQFLATMSHEIRTPLGVIMGAVELLRDQDQGPQGDPGEDREQRGHLFSMIDRNALQLSTLISDILDLSKVEAGSVEIEMIPFTLKEMCETLIADLRLKANGRPISLEFKNPDELPIGIKGDVGRIRQILSNLLSNAIKFADKGFIRLEVAAKSKGEMRSLISFRVVDGGIGMSPAAVSKIFQPFTQADQTITRRYGGTGLGLALSRRLATAMGGDLQLIRTAPGEGSTFELTIDVEVVEGAGKKTAQGHGRSLPQDLSQLQILIIDDSPDNRDVVSRFLRLAKAKVQDAESGDEGIAMVEKDHFDVILLDLQMPGKDGLQTADELRRNGYKGPIVAFTANALRGERERYLAAGFSDYVSKPVDRKALIETLKRLTLNPS